jgi:hypothetical protein
VKGFYLIIGGKPKIKPTKKGSFLDPILKIDWKKFPKGK